MKFLRRFPLTLILAACTGSWTYATDSLTQLNERQAEFFATHCFDCHSDGVSEGGLDIREALTSADARAALRSWIRIFDRVERGEMPPDGGLDAETIRSFTGEVRQLLAKAEREVLGESRAVWRRMNRQEYQNTLRDLLSAPWLPVAQSLPADGEAELFDKVGLALDTSHVQINRYLQVAEQSLRAVTAKQVSQPDVAPVRYYARDQPAFVNRLRYNEFNRSPSRAVFPLLNHQPDLEILDDEDAPASLADREPSRREAEAFGVVASSYEPLEVRFDEFTAPISGRYRIRFNAYTFWAGPGTGKKWWRPDRRVASKGRRNEPVSIYSRSPPRMLRKLTSFDVTPEPSVHEIEVDLLEGETIQPDAARLFRSRPPAWHNPLATRDGQPGVAFKWMEVSGPLVEQWPSPGHQRLFGDLPIRDNDRDAWVDVVSVNPRADARRLLTRFLRDAYRRRVQTADIDRFMAVFDLAFRDSKHFRDSLTMTYAAVLCSPEFVCISEPAGRLDDEALINRLAYFLWNSTPDQKLRQRASGANWLDREQVERMLDDPRAERFIDAFADYWLDLRYLTETSPDERLYPDYYLDDLLIDSSAEETRQFLKSLLSDNAPVHHLVDCDYVYVNERLANHYGIPDVRGVQLRRIGLPAGHVRGGLLTQASVLKVTANGTTTSPVKRGAWVLERILGDKPPPPQPGVGAIEPDTRGATTIREQLRAHRDVDSCAVCHRRIDPPGFALESFDVLGGWREEYRALPANEAGEEPDREQPPEGFGKNGQPFRFVHSQDVDSSGTLPGGQSFDDIVGLKKRLAEQPRRLARNLVRRWVVYATGAPIRFADRQSIERILDVAEPDGYPVRDLLVGVVLSDLFRSK